MIDKIMDIAEATQDRPQVLEMLEDLRQELDVVGIYQVDGHKTAVVTVDGGYRVLGFGVMSVVMSRSQVEDLIESRQWKKVA